MIPLVDVPPMALQIENHWKTDGQGSDVVDVSCKDETRSCEAKH